MIIVIGPDAPQIGFSRISVAISGRLMAASHRMRAGVRNRHLVPPQQKKTLSKSDYYCCISAGNKSFFVGGESWVERTRHRVHIQQRPRPPVKYTFFRSEEKLLRHYYNAHFRLPLSSSYCKTAFCWNFATKQPLKHLFYVIKMNIIFSYILFQVMLRTRKKNKNVNFVSGTLRIIH